MVKLFIADMMCEHCKKTIYNTLINIQGITNVNIILETKTVEVSGNNLDSNSLISIFKKAGYNAKNI